MNMDFREKQAEWLEAIAAPVDGPEGVGVDPRYGERFSQIKSEIESKSETDYERIFHTAIEVLAKEGKDLRIGGYLLFAAARLQGAQGLNFGLQVLTCLLTDSLENLFPEKLKSRQSALSWIAQDRIIHFIESYSSSLASEELTTLKETYASFCEAAGQILEEGFHWKKLDEWTEKHLKSSTLTSESSGGAAPSSTAMLVEIQSDTQLTQVFRHVLNYYKKNNMYGVYAALTRSIRWSDLKMPPAEDGITRVAPPSASDMAKIESLMEQGQWMDAWLACEDAFMNPSGLFCLDYQRIAHQCAQMVGLGEVSYAIEAHLSSLLRRLPKITSLRFSDESAFASSRMLGWIEQTFSSGPEGGEDGIDYLGQARDQARSVSLTAALKWLSDQPAAGQMERIRFKLMQAQLCIENDQSALALPLLKKLSDEVLEYRMQTLEPSLALQIWRQLQFAFEDQLRRTRNAEGKAEIKKQLQQVNNQICSTDITMASQWL
ncbi:MAG: type VI secretion system domain-containing protein [Natronospirillum sp.]